MISWVHYVFGGDMSENFNLLNYMNREQCTSAPPYSQGLKNMNLCEYGICANVWLAPQKKPQEPKKKYWEQFYKKCI